MTRRFHRTLLALAWVRRSGCSATSAARKFGVAPSTVVRAMRSAGMAVRSRGKPGKVAPSEQAQASQADAPGDSPVAESL